MNGLRVRTVSTSLGEWISLGNEWSQSPCHPVSGSTCPGLAIGAWCGKGTAPGCAWCLRWAMLLRGFRLFGVALHREPKGTKRKLSLCPPFGPGGDSNLFHRITLEFLNMNFYGNSLKFELRCYTYLQSISMHSRLPLTIYSLPAVSVSCIQEKLQFEVIC